MELENIIIEITGISKEYLPEEFKGIKLIENPIQRIFDAILFYDNKFFIKNYYSTKFSIRFYEYFGKKKNVIENYDEVIKEVIEFLKTKEII